MLKAAVHYVDDATTVLENPIARVRFYRNVCGLPACIDPSLGRISFWSGSIGAITLPAQLGAQVKNHMQQTGATAGPVVSHPRSKRWTFIIRPDVPDDVPLFAEMFRLNVTLVPPGAEIALPSPVDDVRVWAHAPRDSFRPSGMAVIEAIRACRPHGRPVFYQRKLVPDQ
ncbi:DNA-directed RNA polymerase subunit beta [Nocardia sp. NPDC005745]|uniref:DNA-directed RNA polymerase subunit beta n=1 Tax=Nocardia sp. NPDC005745 TaxID=3157061 RepID=UPI0034003A60